MNDDNAFTAILCDFGIARIIGTPVVRGQIKPFAFGLTPRYCSPEVKIFNSFLGFISFYCVCDFYPCFFKNILLTLIQFIYLSFLSILTFT